MLPSLSKHKPSGENVLAVSETERPCLISPGTDLCSFPSDKLQMWNSPAPCPREGYAVAEQKAACDPLTQHFKQHCLSTARDALQLLSSVTKHSSSVYVSAICGQVAMMLIQSNLPLWIADQMKYIQCIVYLEQEWWFYRACAATRFAALKGKVYKASIRNSTNILLLASSPTTICPSFLIWNKCCRFPGHRWPIVCLERLMMKWESNTGVPLGGKGECNNRLYSKSMGTSCKTPENREGWTSCFLHDNPCDFFFQFGKKKILIHMHSWETPLVGPQLVNGTPSACGSCTDKKGFKKQRSFLDLLSMKLAILASLPISAPQAPLSLQPGLMLSEAWQCCAMARGRACPPSATDSLTSP